MNMNFKDHDKFGRKQFADRLTKAISTFYPLSQGSYVLSLNAKYGSGKTTFLKMWQTQLEQEDPAYKVIYIDAWESDFDEDPIVPIVSAFLSAIETEKAESFTDKAVAALKGVLIATSFSAKAVIEEYSGINTDVLIDAVEANLKGDNAEKKGEALYKEYSYKLSAYRELKTALSEYVRSLNGRPLIVLVDELDRVRPNYAISFLEAIKHIFSVKGLCFVLAVDRAQLELSTQQIYGEIDFNNYYRRFITREANLPAPQISDMRQYTRHLQTEFWNEKNSNGTTFCFEKKDQPNIASMLADVSTLLGLSPRQVHELFRIFTHFMAIEGNPQLAKENWVIATSLLIAIQVHALPKYRLIGAGNLSPNELVSYMLSQSPLTHENYHIFRVAIAFCLNKNDQRDVSNFVSAHNNLAPQNSTITREDAGDELSKYRRIASDYGDLGERTHFQYLYDRLEGWLPLIS